jgi:hypothetical protein
MSQTVRNDVETIQRFIANFSRGVLGHPTLDDFTAATDRTVGYCDQRRAPFSREPLIDFKERVVKGLRSAQRTNQPRWIPTTEDCDAAGTANVLCNRIKNWVGGPAGEAGADRDQAGVENGSGTSSPEAVVPLDTTVAPEPPTEPPRLPPSHEKAYRQYKDATDKNPTQLNGATDREVYEWLQKHAEDEKLPSLDSWARYLRNARRHYGDQKNTPRAGRPTGKSVVRKDEIE